MLYFDRKYPVPRHITLAILFFCLCNGFTLVAQQKYKPIPGQTAAKMAPGVSVFLQNKALKNIRVFVHDKVAFAEWMAASFPGVGVKQLIADRPLFELSAINENTIRLLAASANVQFIDVANRIPKEELSVEGADLSINAISAVHSLFPQLNGEGKLISVKERPFDTSDIDLKGRVIPGIPLSSPFSAHATTMATLIAGGGNSSVFGKGVAWKATLSSSDFTNLLPDDGLQMIQQGISVQNHSYGVAIENYYGLESYAYDRQTYQFPHLVHVFSAGNEGNASSTTGTYAAVPNFANLTGQFKMSKNTLSVGAIGKTGNVDPLSSRGPAYDGRIKPELVAFGEGGTSESAALVSGVSALLQQAYQQKYDSLPPAALVKALLINSADDVGRPGLDFESGFGKADALDAVRTLEESRFRTGAVSGSQQRQFRITVPAGTNELKVTLTWHDPEAVPDSPAALVNDLDLQVFHAATGISWKPWVLNPYPHPDSLALPAKRLTDRLNNVEQITLQQPLPGEYIIRISAYSLVTSSQNFSLAYQWESGFEWVHPVSSGYLKANENNFIRWQWKGEPREAVLSFRSIYTTQWHEIGQVSLSQLYYEWNPSDSLTQVQLRLAAGNTIHLSDTFTVLKNQPLHIGYNCNEEVLLHWPAAEEATHYQLYRMGDMYLEPFMVVTDTLAVLNKSQHSSVHYAVAPFKHNLLLGRSNTLDYTRQEIGCYIRSFLAAEFVSDTIALNLELSTVYTLRHVSLERWENGTFRSIETLLPLKNLQYRFNDPAPLAGRNVYRVRIENVAGESFYSQSEEVFFIREDDLLVFPNPVPAGQVLNVVEAEDKAMIARFYDLSGKFIYSYSETGIIKEIPTSKLSRGTYILKIETERRTILQSRVVVL